MKNSHIKFITILVFILITSNTTFSQVLISNSSGTPDNSAMLEIKSNDKGMLIPRLTTAQRATLATTAVPGLLVFDKTIGSFFIWGKDSKGDNAWIDLSVPAGIWETNNSNVFLANTYSNVGIGDTNERIIFDTSGDIEMMGADVGIGTQTPTEKLDVISNISANQNAFCISLTAGENITAGDVLVVDANSDFQVVKSSTASDQHVVGIAVKDATSGNAVTIAISGVVEVNVTGTVTRGQYLETSSTNGRADANSTADSGDFGIALTEKSGNTEGKIWMIFKKAEY